MVNDPELEREPMGDPAETDPQTTRKDDEELEAPDFAPEKQPEK